jgi:hypothetical protein
MTNLINCGTCGYPLTPEERTSLIERNGVMVKPAPMTTERALDLALEALELANSLIDGYYLPKEKAWLPEIEEAITAIKQARSAPVQELVAWTVSGKITDWSKDFSAYQTKHYTRPVYTPPGGRQSEDCLTAAQRQSARSAWVGLTDKDWNRSKHNYDFQKGVDWAESILKEKNA